MQRTEILEALTAVAAQLNAVDRRKAFTVDSASERLQGPCGIVLYVVGDAALSAVRLVYPTNAHEDVPIGPKGLPVKRVWRNVRRYAESPAARS